MNPPEKAKFLRRVLSDLLIFCVLYETEKRNAVKKTLIYPCSLDKDILYDRFAAHPLDLRTADGSILDTTSRQYIQPHYERQGDREIVRVLEIFLYKYTVNYLVNCRDGAVILTRKKQPWFAFVDAMGWIAVGMFLLFTLSSFIAPSIPWPASLGLAGITGLAFACQLYLLHTHQRTARRVLDEYMTLVLGTENNKATYK